MPGLCPTTLISDLASSDLKHSLGGYGWVLWLGGEPLTGGGGDGHGDDDASGDFPYLEAILRSTDIPFLPVPGETPKFITLGGGILVLFPPRTRRLGTTVM
jgi:hypothetical protein